MSHHYLNRFLGCCAVALLLAGCNSGGGGGDGGGDDSITLADPPVDNPGTLTGQFIDAPVAGAEYHTATLSGVTAADGSFEYAIGETITLSIGPVQLGHAAAGRYVTPLDLLQDSAGMADPRVLAMASFLQTADADRNLGNGIEVTTALAQALCDQLGLAKLDFDNLHDFAGFDAALQAAAASQGLSYVPPAAASAHLAANLMAMMEQTSEYKPDWSPLGAFTAAARCAQCHQARNGEAPLRLPAEPGGEDISPYTDWQHSLMAHSFDDPYFQAVLEEESTHEFPAYAGAIEDRCLTCHAPMGRTHAHKTGNGLDADGFYRYSQALSDQHGREGVSCTLCHQISSTAVDTEGNAIVGEDAFSGRYTIGDARTIYGPYAGVRLGPMQNNVDYTPQYGHHMTESGHCASCHTVRTPVMDPNTGAPALPEREFLEQAPYQEWANSVFSRGADLAQRRSCQDCHMPVPQDYATAIATRPDNLPERSPFSRHRFFGGNTHMLEILKEFREVLGIAGSTTEAGFEDKLVATQEFLATQSADLELPRVDLVAGNLEIDALITNHGGHKLPSAYPSRRAWLHLKVRDRAGQVLFESGAPGADGRLSIDVAATRSECLASTKPAGFVNGDCIEPHRDLITDPGQVAVYEAVLGDLNGHVNHVLLYADRYLKDNRIPPRGFRRAGAVEGTEIELGGVVDVDFSPEDADGGSGSDRVRYRIPLGNSVGPYQVEARLLYQSIRPSFVAGLHGSGDRVERFRTMYKMLPPRVEELATASKSTF